MSLDQERAYAESLLRDVLDATEPRRVGTFPLLSQTRRRVAEFLEGKSEDVAKRRSAFPPGFEDWDSPEDAIYDEVPS